MSASPSDRGPRVGVVGLAVLASILACHADIRFDDLMGCVQDCDCVLPSLHCDSSACVACASDAHCTAPGLPRCDMAIHRCVECGLATDCAGGATCKTGHCAAPCSAGCPASAPRCDDGACVQCDDGVGCNGVAAGPFCVTHVCSSCAADKDCGGVTPRCDAVVHRCVQCQLNSDCPDATPLCDITVGACVAAP